MFAAASFPYTGSIAKGRTYGDDLVATGGHVPVLAEAALQSMQDVLTSSRRSHP
jgi:hypothetical protein